MGFYQPETFNEKKATQVAARFLLASGRKMPYISLIKLMYFMDREALRRWGSPVTDDSYFSLPRGPILSRVKELIDEESEGWSFWGTYISSPRDYMIELRDEAGNDQLSKAEERLIDEIHAQYGHLSRWQLIRLSHELPEWKDPDGGRLPISVEEILTAVGMEPEEAKKLSRDLAGVKKMRALLAG